jgi:hypothetical protein
VEVKRGLSPKVERGFHNACADLSPERRFVVYSGTELARKNWTPGLSGFSAH